LDLSFDRNTGTLVSVQNKLAGEAYQVSGDEVEVEAVEFRIRQADAKLMSLHRETHAMKARYQQDGIIIDVAYTLRGESHFAEKHVALVANRNYGLKKVVLSRPTFSGGDLRIVPYRYPKFGRKPGEEPICTFFGRTPEGGVFTGVEVPFDASALQGRQVTLGYAPALKVAAGERLACEPVYFGVYRRGPGDQERKDLPLRSESEAMVAMTSTILGPPRFGLVPMACGWHCEMEHSPYTEQSVAGDMKSLDFLAECGIDWVSDSHPWGGERDKMSALGPTDKYEPGPLVRKFLEHAQKVGVKVVMWPTMNNTHPWGGGKPFRADKPEWLMTPLRSANCMGCFTLLESGTEKNLSAGDQIRTWSRVRVHRDFFPHYLDQPLLFPSREGGPGKPGNWPSEHIDYIMLSALSSSPNQLYYLPTKSGIPTADKAELRKWLDWGRKNIEYLKVRKDLPDWPAPGVVDGSAHVLSDQGLVFLFNSGKKPLEGRFALTDEGIGLKSRGNFQVSQEYPPSNRRTTAAFGQTVCWEVPGETAVVLKVQVRADQR
jgi:hypothetical protein